MANCLLRRSSLGAFIMATFFSFQWLLFPAFFIHLQLCPHITAWHQPLAHTRSLQFIKLNHRCHSSRLFAKVVADDINSPDLSSSLVPTNNDNEDADDDEEEEEDMENNWDTFFEETTATSKTGQKFLRESDLDQNRDLDLILTERAERYAHPNQHLQANPINTLYQRIYHTLPTGFTTRSWWVCRKRSVC